MAIQKTSFKNPLRLIINTTIVVFIILLIVYIGTQVALAMIPTNIDTNRNIELIRTLSENIRILSIFVFNFVRPFLQLIIILIVLEWLLNKFGLTLNRESLRFEWNVQTVIGLVVIIAFSLAALSGVEGAS